ncbi:MAG: DUF3365 domain-containing protein, partial [Campylobacteraceae bacterium]|nr:DUF3365 domain-containing protein [Campylobacteraceae bacterium]
MIKLNIKFISIFLTLLYIVMVFFFYNFYKNLVIKDAKQEVIAILNTTKAIRNYIENIQKPVIYKLKKEGKLYKDFFDPKLLSSSYVVSHIYKLQNSTKLEENSTPYKYKLAATNPRNPKNRADKFERKILNKFRTENIQQYSTILKEKGKNYFFVAIPVTKNKKSCMKCHSTPEIAPKEMLKLYGKTAGFYEKIGDLRAMISLKIPIAHIVSTHIRDFFITIFIAFIVFVTFYIFIYIIYKKNLKFQRERELLLLHQNKLA